MRTTHGAIMDPILPVIEPRATDAPLIDVWYSSDVSKYRITNDDDTASFPIKATSSCTHVISARTPNQEY